MLPLAQVSPEEVQKIVAGMDDPSELQAGGVHLGGTKYMFIQSDDRLVAGKKVRFRRHRRETERRRRSRDIEKKPPENGARTDASSLD